MNQRFCGDTAILGLAIDGRLALGLISPEDLAVDDAVDLGVDGADDLAVFDGVRWSGLGAAKSIAVMGQAFDAMNAQ